jgi:hypothetical protein
LVKKYFSDRWVIDGPIDSEVAIIDFDNEHFIEENQAAFTEDKIRYAFVKDMSFAEPSKASCLVINDLVDKRS